MTRAYCWRGSGEPKKGGVLKNKKGFALILVLIIAFVGLAMAGLLAEVMTVSASSNRVANAEIMKSNLLRSALEEGKATLKEVMDNKNPALRYFDNKNPNITSATTDITSVTNLYLADPRDKSQAKPLGYKKDRGLGRAALGALAIFGDSGSIGFRIYDMRYDPKLVKVSPAEMEFLPAAAKVRDGFDVESYSPDEKNDGRTPGGCGIYLVRATLSVKGRNSGSDKVWILDSAIIQSSRL